MGVRFKARKATRAGLHSQGLGSRPRHMGWVCDAEVAGSNASISAPVVERQEQSVVASVLVRAYRCYGRPHRRPDCYLACSVGGAAKPDFIVPTTNLRRVHARGVCHLRCGSSG